MIENFKDMGSNNPRVAVQTVFHTRKKAVGAAYAWGLLLAMSLKFSIMNSQ